MSLYYKFYPTGKCVKIVVHIFAAKHAWFHPLPPVFWDKQSSLHYIQSCTTCFPNKICLKVGIHIRPIVNTSVCQHNIWRTLKMQVRWRELRSQVCHISFIWSFYLLHWKLYQSHHCFNLLIVRRGLESLQSKNKEYSRRKMFSILHSMNMERFSLLIVSFVIDKYINWQNNPITYMPNILSALNSSLL